MKTKVLIPNATSPTNIGDLAMLNVLIKLIKDNVKDCEIVLHSSEPNRYPADYDVKNIKNTIYSYAVFHDLRFFVRLWRMLKLCAYVLLFITRVRLFDRFFIKDKLFSICLDYINSDMIFYVGGGYLRSRSGITQTFNLLMQVLLVQFSKYTQAKVIVCPISFGPFAYSWQQKIAGWVLKNINVVAARESISYRLLAKEKVQNLILASDHAFLVSRIASKNRRHLKVILGITVKKWLDSQRQEKFEDSIVKAVSLLASKHKLVVFPIAQVVNRKYGDMDDVIVASLAARLDKLGVEVKPLVKLKNVDQAKRVYAKLDVLLGMRMHSNIIAATQGVPFLSLAYEHKTTGIARTLGLDKYSIKVEKVDDQNIKQILDDLIAHRKNIGKLMTQIIDQIKFEEKQRWGNIISTL